MPMESHDRDIFAIVGLAPEVQAVAFAKYSRSQESVKTTIDDLTDEKSAEFHEKWVIGYGDASVADMAMIAIALENVSMLASKAIEDHRLASYQEKSTRYVPFDPTRFHKPAKFMDDPATRDIYLNAIQDQMDGYTYLLEGMVKFFREKYPKPEDLGDKPYESRLRARALDVARYALPISTLTNLGMIASAREIRYMISRLLASHNQEVREVGEEIKKAALENAYNPNAKRSLAALAQLEEYGVPEEVTEAVRTSLRLSVAGAPTLIKHTDPREYLIKKDRIAKIAGLFLEQEDLGFEEPRVDLVSDLSPEDELVASLLYPQTTVSL
ncbi:MAG: FAD-dependent thymidylate synthase, partial [Candidatus Magasanikbacteria bacterium]|nr:FAD-dependent thymidylate synthase [Candidatus Magasanikbacteria bacterium]